MHAWRCDDPSGVAALRWVEQPTPEPAAGEVRVAIRAASLNFPDLLVVNGKYQFRPTPPFVPGAEFAGVVEAVGAGVTGIAAGAAVMSVGVTGAFASHVCVPTGKLVPVPRGAPFEDAAAFLMTYGTSHHALADRAALRAGETLLVLGAAGGVGTAAIQIGKALGAHVVAAVSSDEKAALCRSIGADQTINYSATPLREGLRSALGERSPDVVYDPVGGALAEPAFRSIAWRGRYLVVGFADGAIPSLPLNLPLLKGASVVGVFWGDFTRREPANFARSLAELGDWYAAGRIKPVIDCVLPMERLPAAFERMASRRVGGKIVLRLGAPG
ncbi:MAG: NADPH:quinone oxidoreductase family protein [Proteobacteria bacterium]|nr:NADPH:quinone oxidoreductase family protein [Pseudomonadota bacterium]